jgi:hypothetical protein
MRRPDLRWLVVFAGNALFLFIVAQLNHHLTRVSLGFTNGGPVYLFLLGLPVAFAALRLHLAQGLVTVVATALFMEASMPIKPGALMLAAAACFCITIAIRTNFNRFEPSSAMIAAVLINLTLIAALTLFTMPGGGTVSLLRIFVDLVISQCVLAAICGWFFAWQLALLRVFGFNLETELSEPL